MTCFFYLAEFVAPRKQLMADNNVGPQGAIEDKPANRNVHHRTQLTESSILLI
jgi:hypothetical protein